MSTVDMILSQIASYKVQRGKTKKRHIQELWLLCSAHRLMMLNTRMKIYEHILNGFKVIERTWFCHRNCYLQSSKGRNSKVSIQELWFLHTACRLMLSRWNLNAWIVVKCGLLLMWFHLLTSIVVLENKIFSLVEGAWQSVLDCVDRFVAGFNLGD